MYPVIDMKATGRRIRFLIRAKGLTVRDVQEYLGMAWPHSIYHWFDGKNLPTLDNLYALSGMLQVPVDLLLCGKENRICRTSPFSDDPVRSGRLLMYLERYIERKDLLCASS